MLKLSAFNSESIISLSETGQRFYITSQEGDLYHERSYAKRQRYLGVSYRNIFMEFKAIIHDGLLLKVKKGI